MSAKFTEDGFWNAVDSLVKNSPIVIDRLQGSHHPKYPALIYPLDYGFLEDTRSMDGHGIDVWQGSLGTGAVQAIVCTVDLVKRDSEIKLLIGCTAEEIQQIMTFHNQGQQMKAILIERPSRR
jgi:inorganic pyrophosphatase